MKRLIIFLSISACFADNTEIYKKAYQLGEQHQFNLNLNTNSTINSYGQANKFTHDVADNANKGNTPAKNMYDNTYGEKANPNYLYNAGIEEIKACQNEHDPRCTTLNKYGDKDTQTQIQAYTQGFSAKYQISVTPDPSDSQCMISKRKVPINQTIATCTAGLKERNQCNNTITPYREYINVPPQPSDGTVIASGFARSDCNAGWVTSTSTITVSENLTRSNMVHLHMDNMNTSYCGYNNQAFFNQDISFSGFNSRVYYIEDISCDFLYYSSIYDVTINSNGCSGDFCSYIVTVSSRNAYGENSSKYYLNFNKPKIGSYYTVDHYPYNDQCSAVF